MAPRRMLGLAAIGSAAGLFSGLFGVGGGAVVVPLLVLRFAYPDRAGLLGVGGGVLFVPALTVFLGLGQVDAEATSLLAIMPMALVGAWRQHGYGNLRARGALVLGALSVPGAVAGVSIVEIVPERAVKVAFAGLMLVIAAQMVRRAPARPTDAPESG